jgi:hypothetical protein
MIERTVTQTHTRAAIYPSQLDGDEAPATAAADDTRTVISPDAKPTQHGELAWSLNDDEDDDTDLYPDDDDPKELREHANTTLFLWICVAAAAAAVVIALVAALFSVMQQSEVSTVTPPATSVVTSPPDVIVAPAPIPTVTQTAPPPPPVTVTADPPPAAVPQHIDPRQAYLNAMRNDGIIVADPLAAEKGAHEICAYLAAGHTPQEAARVGMSQNSLMTLQEAEDAISVDIQFYCPQYG